MPRLRRSRCAAMLLATSSLCTRCHAQLPACGASRIRRRKLHPPTAAASAALPHSRPPRPPALPHPSLPCRTMCPSPLSSPPLLTRLSSTS